MLDTMIYHRPFVYAQWTDATLTSVRALLDAPIRASMSQSSLFPASTWTGSPTKCALAAVNTMQRAMTSSRSTRPASFD